MQLNSDNANVALSGAAWPGLCATLLDSLAHRGNIPLKNRSNTKAAQPAEAGLEPAADSRLRQAVCKDPDKDKPVSDRNTTHQLQSTTSPVFLDASHGANGLPARHTDRDRQTGGFPGLPNALF